MSDRKYEFLAVAYGGGLNSKAMLIEWHNRALQCPDLILFADTGGELPETYAEVASFSEWLVGIGYPPVITVQNTGKHKTLEQECLAQETIPSLAFGWKKCSEKYKARPQNGFTSALEAVKELFKSGGKITKLIGIDAGEEHRKKIEEDAHYRYLYPLVDWQIDREGCVRIVEAAGLPVPPKSSCFFCPASTKREVLALRAGHPDLFDRAVAMEENAAPNLKSVKGLGRNWNWGRWVAGQRKQLTMFDDAELDAEPCESSCMCLDGGGK